MRIAIDARYVTDHFPGIGRYIYNLLCGLADLDQPHTFAVLYNPRLPNTRYALDALSRYLPMRLIAATVTPFSLAEQIQIPRLLHSLRADLYHAPYYVRPYRNVACPSITTLYDIIPHRFPSEATARARMLFDLLTRQAIKASRHLLAISRSAGDDFCATYHVPAARITVTPLAADQRFLPQSRTAIAALRKKYDLPEQYVLCVSSNKPHKNLPTLIQAWARLKAEQPVSTAAHGSSASNISTACLVIAGQWDTRYTEVQQLVVQLGLQGSVRFLHGVAEADLPRLYGGATIFVFPSRYEGFGLPPLEAMASGVPVICGDSSSLPEVVGGAALCVDVCDVNALRRSMVMLLSNAALRTRLSAAGLQQAKQFSWHKTAEATLRAYESTQ